MQTVHPRCLWGSSHTWFITYFNGMLTAKLLSTLTLCLEGSSVSIGLSKTKFQIKVSENSSLSYSTIVRFNKYYNFQPLSSVSTIIRSFNSYQKLQPLSEGTKPTKGYQKLSQPLLEHWTTIISLNYYQKLQPPSVV